MSASRSARALSPGDRHRLEALLAAHAPDDAEERAHLAAILDFVRRHPDPFDRGIAEGHLTGSAFVVDPAGRLLLTHHRRLGLWLQLGGHAESERRAEEVALREAREESSLPDLAFHPRLLAEDGAPRLLDVDVHVIPAGRGEGEHLHLDLRFALTTLRPEAIVADPRETRALAWLTLDEARRRGAADLARPLRKVAELVG